MNISKAKKQIKNSIISYLTTDELGNYVISADKRRPILISGPSGIGKSSIMEQIASELGIGLVSYAFVNRSEMSEIIASTNKLAYSTDTREGILLLNGAYDGISNLYAQGLLEGWIVVIAVNSRDLSKFATETNPDILDKISIVQVDVDYDAWRDYAKLVGVHPAVVTYLDENSEKLYCSAPNSERSVVATPRGWSELGEMLRLHEKNGLDVNEDLIIQYIRDMEISEKFAEFYKLFCRIRSEYPVEDILEGCASNQESSFEKSTVRDEEMSSTNDESEESEDIDSAPDEKADFDDDARITTIAEEPTLADILALRLTGHIDLRPANASSGNESNNEDYSEFEPKSKIEAVPEVELKTMAIPELEPEWDTVPDFEFIPKEDAKSDPDDSLLSEMDRVINKARGFDESEARILVGILCDIINSELRSNEEETLTLESVRSCILKWGSDAENAELPIESMNRILDKLKAGRENGMKSKTLSRKESDRMLRTIASLQEAFEKIDELQSLDEMTEIVRTWYAEKVDEHKVREHQTEIKLNNLLIFTEKCWENGREMLDLI